MKEALFYEKLKDKNVQCKLCPRKCIIAELDTGFCRVRQNNDGKLYSLVYGKAVSTAMDPIEKKPLFHFAPGTRTFSIATVGCNLACKFCQNSELSQSKEVLGENISPKEVVELALKYNAQGISYTYTEPTIFYEYVYDIAKLAARRKLYNVMVTNAYINKEPLEHISKYIDAASIDLKAMSSDFYRKLCAVPNYKPILEIIKRYHDLGIHIEIVNLLIPRWNTSDNLLKKLVKWVYDLDPDIPVHFSRFNPYYKMETATSTSIKLLENAYKIAKKQGLNYVYLGNVWDTEKMSTYCPNCGELLVERDLLQLVKFNLTGNRCYRCRTKIAISGLEFRK